MLKRFLVALLTSCILLSSMSFSSSAIHIVLEETEIISVAESNAVATAMHNRGLGEILKCEVVYDASNNPTFLLGLSDNGYIIMTKESLRCIESGEGNPYAEYDSLKKYYGGLMCYCVFTGHEFYDISRGTSVSSVPESTMLLEAACSTMSTEDVAYLASASSTASVTSTVILPHAEMWIKRKAFGYNNDNTCSAVACTIVLDYIDYDNSNIVPSDMQLDFLTFNNGNDVVSKAPRSHKFHRFLVNNCGMGAASWGIGIASAIDKYCKTSTYIDATELKCEWTVNVLGNYAVNEIDAGRPAMLTSTLVGDYDWHTMAIYGYRKLSDGSLEWLVHPGWYSKLEKISDSSYRVQEVWVAASTATFLYRFSYTPLVFTPSDVQTEVGKE